MLDSSAECPKVETRSTLHHDASFVMFYSLRCDTKPSPPIVKAALPELEQRRLCSWNCEGQQHSHQDVVRVSGNAALDRSLKDHANVPDLASQVGSGIANHP